MRLVRQAILHFQQGASDKVYEVDLCEVGDDAFVVNFRYGRRGGRLRDGSKTVVPVPRAEAEQVFDALVASKVGKGYRVLGQPASPAPPPGPKPARASSTDKARERAILARLAGDDDFTSEWPISRVIWRAGELGLRAAEPALLERLGRGEDATTRHALLRALAGCGTAASVGPIEAIRGDAGQPQHIRDVAGEALRQLDDAAQARLADEARARLPAALAAHLADGAALADALSSLRAGDTQAYARALHDLYLIDSAAARTALIRTLPEAPCVLHVFAALRRLFKAAELRRDARIHGLLAHRFETAAPNDIDDWHRMVGSWPPPRDRRPFSVATRTYLRRRSWRTLRKLGEAGGPDFVKLAVGVLLPFTDADARASQQRRYHPWNAEPYEIHWDAYAPYWAFNQILYRNSPRYYPDRRGRLWRCRPPYRPGQPAPDAREEAFPHLWESQPEALLHLCDESACAPVHEFAVRALRACEAFLAALETDAVIMLLGRPYQVTAELGFELARDRYDASRPDVALVRAVVECVHAPGRAQARTWIESQRRHFVADSALMATIAASMHADNRHFARDLLRTTGVADDVARVLVGRLIGALLGLDAGEDERAGDVAVTIQECFPAQLRTLGAEVLHDLARHPAEQAQLLAGTILLSHDRYGRAVPDDILLALLGSPHERVRGLGARLLGNLPDEALRERAQLIVAMFTHELADLRAAIRPVMTRLCASDGELAADLAALLVLRMLQDNPEGVPASILDLLRTELREHLTGIGKDSVLRLLRARSPHAQELGGLLLPHNVDADELTVQELVRLADHEIRAVRQGAWAMCEANIARLRLAMNGAIRLLDSRWLDTREWAFDFFRRAFDDDALTPTVLVGICDSVREEVQRFGQQLIAERFRDADGPEYMVRLSEHPSSSVQLFVTNYLERYARGDVDRLRALEPYFVRLLSAVNRGRIAKKRVIAFLRGEARASREAAQLVAGIFARQSATIAIEYKAALIEGMVEIHAAHPDLALPMSVRPVEVRDGV